MFYGKPHREGNRVTLRDLVLRVASVTFTTSDRAMKHLLKESEWLETQLGQYSAINLEFETTFLGSSLRKFPHIGADSHAVSLELVVVNQRAESRCLSSKAFKPLEQLLASS